MRDNVLLTSPPIVENASLLEQMKQFEKEIQGMKEKITPVQSNEEEILNLKELHAMLSQDMNLIKDEANKKTESRQGYVDLHQALTEAEDNELRVVRVSSDSPIWLKSIYDIKSWVDSELYIPLNVRGQHWFLAIVNLKKRDVTLYNSLSTELKENNELIVVQITDGLRWLFHILDNGSKNWEKPWSLKTISDRPGQDNSDDCGMFMLKYIDFLSSMRKIDFMKVPVEIVVLPKLRNYLQNFLWR
ncbi:uncharacterized protein LOC131226160 [Magnolia sinica]|uniref:uncharacterized protein LOC131226160 n=1 Tax=Magnolia sinica TaxID=86752 RepID=UPI00265A5D77|nr:uncharacterized protein LOC131226160 [Magnolia sinica]